MGRGCAQNFGCYLFAADIEQMVDGGVAEGFSCGGGCGEDSDFVVIEAGGDNFGEQS